MIRFVFAVALIFGSSYGQAGNIGSVVRGASQPSTTEQFEKFNRLLIKDQNSDLLQSSESIGDKLWATIVSQTNKKKLTDGFPTRLNFFNLRAQSELSQRVVVDHLAGLVRFKLLRGSLKSNLVDLLSNTQGGRNTSVLWDVGEQKIESAHWVTGRSMIELMVKILELYSKSEQLMFSLYDGGFVLVYNGPMRDSM